MNLTDRRKSLALLLLGMMLLSSLSAFATIHDSEKVHTLAYASHAPIYINGNSQFTSANGIVSGNGIASDPYIIGGWVIDASAKNGITIKNVTANFIVTGCYIRDGVISCNGIILVNCTNGRLESNICFNNRDDIYLDSSSGNTLINNTCDPNNEYGIYLINSNNNNLSNNICSNGGFGIYLDSLCSNNEIRNNTCLDNSGYGIYVGYTSVGFTSNGNTIAGNICMRGGYAMCIEACSGTVISNNYWSNTDYGLFMRLSSDSMITHNVCSNNWDTGIWIDACTHVTVSNNNCQNNANGMEISSNTGGGNGILNDDAIIDNNFSYNRCGILTLYSLGNTIKNNTCFQNGVGMHLEFAIGNTIEDNNCSSNSNSGIVLESCNEGNDFSGNKFIDNGGFGIAIYWGCSGNSIWNNTFIGNNGAGNSFDSLHVQACDNGTDNHWNTSDGHGNYWSDWISGGPSPYKISGYAGAKDYHPFMDPEAYFANIILNTLLPIAATIIAVILASSFIILMWRKRRAVEPPSSSQ